MTGERHPNGHRPRLMVAMSAGPVRDSFFPREVVARLKALGEVTWNDAEGPLQPGELAERLRGVEVCFTGWGAPRFDVDLLHHADRLGLVAHTGGSVAGLVSPELYDRGIRVVSGNRVFAESVAESVVGYALLALRRLPYWAQEVQAGRWRTEEFRNEGLLDQSVGLVGFGAVARLLVPMLRPFRCRVRAYDPHVTEEVFRAHGVEPCDLDELLAGSRIISLHVARTPATHHLLDARRLRLIPDGALLINTARGAIVDETALAAELAAGRFMAVLDVFDTEPLPADSPLRGHDHAILVPHMAGPTIDRRCFAALAVVEDAGRFLAGVPLEHEIGRDYAMAMTR